jgi:UDP-N-acetylglucosamine acyltransferase
MATRVHSTALVHRDARLGDQVEIGPWAVVEACEIGDDSVVGPSVTIKTGVRVGRGVRIGQGSILGVPSTERTVDVHAPSMVVPSDEGRNAHICVGDGTIICNFTRICTGFTNRTGSDPASEPTCFGESPGPHVGATVLGTACYIMSYVVVGPGCRIGDRALVTNLAQLGAHVVIGAAAGVSGLVVVAPGVRIGQLAFVGGCSQVFADVPPFTMAQGAPAHLYGLNKVGLRRAGLPADVVRDLKRTYQLLFRDSMDPRTAVARAQAELPQQASGPVRHLLDFVNAGTRAIAAPRQRLTTSVSTSR